MNEVKLPKLPKAETSISLLREEASIEPIYRGFSSIARFGPNESTEEAARYQVLPLDIVRRVDKDRTTFNIFTSGSSLNVRLYLVSLYFGDLFRKIVEQYKQVFPFVTEAAMLNIQDLEKQAKLEPVITGKIPVFCIKEQSVDRWLGYHELSSGMRKVLHILTDNFLLPEGGIYLIDEYENSLGIGAIDFFPTFLIARENKNQFIITSHHPYIINRIPVEDWFIFHRKGSQVSIQHGEPLKDRFGKSRQQAFIQLINDPFYREGIG